MWFSKQDPLIVCGRFLDLDARAWIGLDEVFKISFDLSWNQSQELVDWEGRLETRVKEPSVEEVKW